MTDTDALSIEVGMISSPHPHAPMHVKTLETLPEVTAIHLCGVADEDTDALGEGASKVQSVTTSIDELLARPEVTALVVCTRNDLCPDILNAAVEAGKPVLFEKPGALTAADLRAVADRAHERGLTMGTFFQNRWNPAMRDAVEVCRSGALGRIMAVEARMVTSQVRYRNPGHWLFRKDTAGTGILSWLGCHYLDLLCYFLDDRVVEVAALVGQQNPEQIEVEDTACLALRFSSGVLGTLHAGYHLIGSAAGYSGAAYDTFMGFRGTDGYLRLPREMDGFTVHSLAPGWEGKGKQDRVFEPAQSPAYGGVSGEEFLRAFLQASRTGAPGPAPIDAAVHVLEIIEAAIESSDTGRTVRIG